MAARGKIPVWLARRFINLWPPLLFAGIRVRRADERFREVEVALKLRWWNRNSMGTAFGGSLFAMTDPFYMLMLQWNLGPAYVVWDQAAEIVFLSPGRGTVRARFVLDEPVIGEIVAATASGAKYLPEFWVEVTDKAGVVVARVKRVVYVRRKREAAR
jgi:acyl-coenzyme A thioesterase PaaI-like protein